jgi:hypothetical protein
LPSSLAFLFASVRLHALATSALQGAERISRSCHPSSTLLFSLVSPDYIARLNSFPSPSTPCVDAYVLSEALIYDRHNFLLFGWVLRPRRWPPPGLLLPRKPAAFLPLTSASLSIQSDPSAPKQPDFVSNPRTELETHRRVLELPLGTSWLCRYLLDTTTCFDLSSSTTESLRHLLQTSHRIFLLRPRHCRPTKFGRHCLFLFHRLGWPINI